MERNKLKIAISTCQTGMVESLSAMFSEHEWHILGIRKPSPEWDFHMAVQSGVFGRNVVNHFQDEEPIEKLNIEEYDLLIDVAESNDYNPKWREAAIRWKIPRLFYLTNPAPKTTLIRKVGWLGRRVVKSTHPIYHYYRQLRGFPIVYTNEQLQSDWGLKGEVIHFSHDEWGIGGWVGRDPKMLLGKNGYYTWAKPEDTPLADLFQKLERAMGDELIIHDASRDPMAEEDWRDFVAKKRLWFEHDFGSTGRSLCQGVVKAMCLGLPVLQWKTSICQGWRFVKNGVNGLVTDNIDEAVRFAKRLIDDFDLAKKYSEEMVREYEWNLSWRVAKPEWEKAMRKAIAVYEMS